MRIATWNIEWFDDHFAADGSFVSGEKRGRDLAAQREGIAAVLRALDADAVLVTEGPMGHTARDLTRFAAAYDLRLTEALTGFPSAGRQEIALWYDPAKLAAEHDPLGTPGDRVAGPFDEEFFLDADEDGIREIYRHVRPPLEARITPTNPAINPFWMIGVHAKSKGIFSRNDLLNYRRIEEANRRRLFAECAHIRLRVEQMQREGKHLLVLGDINDGPGMDAAELRFGRSAVEIVMGSLFEPDRILRSWAGEPRWTSFGFEPSTARFRDKFTGDVVNVLIDHILASDGLAVAPGDPHVIWNPFQTAQAKPLKDALLAASDHFPVTLDLM